MKIVVGLGNPGQEYNVTRHNVGFMTIDYLAGQWGVDSWRSKFDALVTEYRGDENILLLKPQTYMNLSGRAVIAALNWYKLAPEELIVVYDDLDLAVGRLRIRSKGGAGGHRGIESLLQHLGKDSFCRVRIGIGRPPQYMETANYVLGRFGTEEVPVVEQAIKQAAAAVEAILKYGAVKAGNEFNR